MVKCTHVGCKLRAKNFVLCDDVVFVGYCRYHVDEIKFFLNEFK